MVLRRSAAIVSLALFICLGGPVAAADEAPAPRCDMAAGVKAEAVRVIDGETVQLADGRQLRLLGALAPEPPVGTTAETWIPATESKRALTGLVEGRNLLLAFRGNGNLTTDRHGRLLAQAYLETEGREPLWIQGEMLSRGQARAYALPGHADCLSAMTARERAARDAGLGLWQHAAYRVLEAAEPREIMRRRSELSLVEGRVSNAAERGGRLYLNFGTSWRDDFTVVVPPRVLRVPDAGPRLNSLAGRRVLVRGWIERRNGPAIELTDPGAIEVVE